MTDFAKVLLAVAPHGKPEILAGFAAALPACIADAGLTTPARLADFIAQCAHESAGFCAIIEYASGKAYEWRKDLGNTHAGDGVKYKGRGEIELTGRANYKICGAALGLDLVNHPELAAEFPTAALTASWYWKTHGLNKFADNGDFKAETLRINGGYNGLSSRLAYRAKAMKALANVKIALLEGAAIEAKAARTKATGVVAAVTPAGAALSLGAQPSPVNHALLGSGGEWALIAVGAACVAGAIWLFLSIRKHQDAAAALTAAAKGA